MRMRFGRKTVLGRRRWMRRGDSRCDWVMNETHRRKGAVTVLAAFLVIPLFAFLAFSVDVGYMTAEKARLTAAADAAALASVYGLPYPARLAGTRAAR